LEKTNVGCLLATFLVSLLLVDVVGYTK